MPLPKPSGDFVWTQEAWGPALRCVPLLAHAPHLYTTRHLILRGAPADTASAWAQVAAAVKLAPPQLTRLRQVHGARVVEAGSSAPTPPSPHEDWPEADVVISNDPAMGLVVRVADCVPLLIADRRTGAVAAVHAGWRGTAAGAALAAVGALGRAYGSRPADVVAAIGPSIGPCCYTVGREIAPQFGDHPEALSWFILDDRPRLDLWAATRDQLLRAGAAAENVHCAELCTVCHVSLFCSYRKEGNKTGRMAGVIRTAS